ncbi:MAG: cytochrome c biogenesis protein CcsA [Chitinophagaceae bacterium]|nr:cytochrome c biogenesis protein CcsA [Chitinophagaceae bacterium]
MDYIGEQLLPGQLGHFFIILSMVAALLASVAYFLSAQAKNPGDENAWKKLGRIAFLTQVFSIFAVFGLLFYIIHNHLFEYHYAWKHSSRSLELKYLLSCFWEGQEGSFLLWSACHAILGSILIKRSGQWEAPVMSVLSITQFALATMVAGLYIFGWKMGSNPFILLRDSGVFDNAPAMHVNFDINQPVRPDYLQSVTDGNDLNPLLQNYWMVIHPPFLFMGFASTTIPFAFAMAGLWKKQYGEWTKPALPWALFSAAVLGVGIMMGGMWAYESLTFGGYWAWDPVENASLVPWMIGISGIHTLLIYRHSGHSLRATYLFFILSFGFVLYSTFLTRSGILGEASVHAFTDLGMNWQLSAFLFAFTIPPLIYFARNYRKIPSVQQEENISSREFWIFIGALVFFLSAIVIIGQTSTPVLNKVLGTNIAPPEDAEFSYNSIQIYVAIIVAALTAFSQYLRYKDTPRAFFWKKMLIPGIITLVFCALFLLLGDIKYDRKGPVFNGSIWLAVFCSIYTIVANFSYIWLGLKGKLRLSGGSVAHVGFGMVLLGILISSSNKDILSNNIGGIPAPLAEGENPRENLTLIKDMTANMGRYSLTYLGDSAHPKKEQWYYKIRVKSNDGKEDFVLMPNAFVNYKGNEGLMANPDARHYWDHDVFAYITSVPNPDNAKDTASFKPYTRKPGDSLFYSNGYIVINELKRRDSVPEDLFGKEGFLYELPLTIHSKTGSIYTVTTHLANAKTGYFALPDTVPSESLVLQLQKVNPDQTMELGVKESGAVMKYVTLKAYRYPMIRLLWYGVWITAIGILISMVHRIRMNRRKSQEQTV